MSSGPADALPVGWCGVRLEDLLHGIEAGKSFRCDPRPAREDEWGVIKVSAMTWGTFDDAENKVVPDDRVDASKEIRTGDILLSRSNTAELVGATVLVGTCRTKLLLSDKSLRLLYPKALSPRWLQGALSSPALRAQMSGLATGTSDSMRNLSQDKLYALTLLLPPVNEQLRIVDALDELLSDLDAGVAALERVRVKLKHYRAAVLKVAVEGALTEEWRRQHPATETADALLARILAERRRRWEEAQLAKFAAAGKTPPKGWEAKYVEPDPPDSAKVPVLPTGWCWASPDQIGEVQLGRQRSPAHHKGEFMRPYLRVANVYEDRIDLSSVYEMNFSPKEFETYVLRSGDILLNEGQSLELVGRSAVYRDELPGACFTNTLVRFRPCKGVESEFAQTYFRACLRSHRFRRIARWTTNIAHLGADRFGAMEFPLPPQDEQLAIVEAVSTQLSVVDHLERDIESKLKSAQALRESILRLAFTGRLVPQDPNDEPATELLKRIATEREERARLARTAKQAKPRGRSPGRRTAAQ